VLSQLFKGLSLWFVAQVVVAEEVEEVANPKLVVSPSFGILIYVVAHPMVLFVVSLKIFLS
jgi:hypothetical protein